MALLDKLETQGTRDAERLAERRRTQVAAALAEAVPGMKAELDGVEVVLSGRRLLRRYVLDGALRRAITEVSHER